MPLTLLAAVALSALVAPSAFAATKSPASLTISSVDPATADGGAYNFTIGFTGADDPAAGFVNGAKTGHCIELGVNENDVSNAILRTGTQGADLTLVPGSLAAAAGGANRLQWLLQSSARSRATTTGAARNNEAAAHQLAVWLLTDAPGGATVTANDPAALARANELLGQSATYGPSSTTTPALTAQGAETCGQTARTIRVSGAPYSSATVTIASGSGQLTGGTDAAGGQSTTVTLDANGTADIRVNAAGFGAIRLTASVTTQTLVQVDAGASAQDFAYLEPRTVSVETTVNFTPCPSTPAPPVVVGGIETTRLAITKIAPPSVRAGGTITYAIRVRNTTDVTAKNVVITDILPSGTSVVTRSKNARFTNGRLTWNVGDLGPRKSRALSITLRVDNGISRPRCNTAMAKAGNAAEVRARVCTAIVAGVRFQPIVTG
jgi:uncharacterized repeat protein (TIGR01451 family)